MSKLDGVIHDLLQATEFVTIVTNGAQGPHLVGNWGDYLRAVGTDWVGTQLPLEAGEWLYGDTGATVLAVPHAVNEAVFRRAKAGAGRRIDVGARSCPRPR